MAQTYTDWDKVPPPIEAKIRKFWNGLGTVAYGEGFDTNGDKVTVYRLAHYKVRENADYLTDAQKLKMFDIANGRDLVLSSMLDRLAFELETVRVHNEIYHLPGVVVGTFPHCNMFGAMDETGYVHT